MDAQNTIQQDFIVPHRILAATDLGPHGEAAIRVAHARAAEVGGKLAVCHVVAEPSEDGDATARRLGALHDDLARAIAASLGTAADTVDVFVPVGEPAKQIHDTAEAWNAELVVIGCPDNPGGILARLFKPKTVEKVVRWSPCAVLVTRPSPGSGRIIVGTDFSDPSMPVLRAAAAEQARTGGVVHAIHCVPPSASLPIGDPAAGVVPPANWDEIDQAMLERLEQCSKEAGLVATAQIIRDSATSGLVQAAKDLAADLVIVGTHGRGGIARLALGSVAQHVVNDAPCPVLVVRLDHH